MRSRDRIERTPAEHRDASQAERAAIRRELMLELERARASRAEWYVWVLEGRQPLSEAAYALVGRHRAGRRLAAVPSADELERNDGLEPQGLFS